MAECSLRLARIRYGIRYTRTRFSRRKGIRVGIRGARSSNSGLPRIRYGITDARGIFSGCFTHQVAGQWEYGTMDGIMYNLKHIHQYYTCSLQAGATLKNVTVTE